MSHKLSTFFKKLQEHDFEQLAKRTAHPRERIRLLAFAHLKDGKTVQQTADAVKIRRNSIYSVLNFIL